MVSIELPDDIWSGILKFLDDCFLLKFQKFVSKGLKRLTETELLRTARFETLIIPSSTTSYQLGAYLNRVVRFASKSTKTLILRDCTRIDESAFPCLRKAFRGSPSLQRVDFRGVSDAVKDSLIYLTLTCTRLWNIQVDRSSLSRPVRLYTNSSFWEETTRDSVIARLRKRKFHTKVLREIGAFQCSHCEQSLHGQSSPCYNCGAFVCKSCETRQCAHCSNIRCVACPLSSTIPHHQGDPKKCAIDSVCTECVKDINKRPKLL
mmetsp:Transcript_13897/g.20015  ORF Transcript_13897/g.20015 Transcript_13897/m.20015 type:complete len:263 (+) Transcript_13897:81-869(+)